MIEPLDALSQNLIAQLRSQANSGNHMAKALIAIIDTQLLGPSDAPTDTTDGTTWLTLATYTLQPSQGLFLSATGLGCRVDGGSAGDMAMVSATVVYRRIGNAAPAADAAFAALYGAPSVAINEGSLAAVPAPRVLVSGNDLLFQVKGLVSTTISWVLLSAPLSVQYFWIK